MLRALPVLIILGLAIYSFFDVLKTEDLLIRRGPKTMWMVVALIPVFGAALWFLVGRPVRERDAYPGPRVISLKRQPQQVAPDDDPNFLRKLDQDAWLRKRQEERDRAAKTESGEPAAPQDEVNGEQSQTDGSGPGSQDPDVDEDVNDTSPDGEAKAKE